MPRWAALAMILMIIARNGSGVVFTGLYEVELPGAARDEASRNDNFRQALSVILGRVISIEAMNSKAGGAILGRAAAFVEEFEFMPAPGSAAPELLRIRFDHEGLRDALQRSGIGVWGAERPEVVVWLWVQDGAERRFINLQETPEFEGALKAAADRRKLPVTAPLGDLTDQTNLTWADAEAGNLPRIREATWRYESDTALVGLLQRSADRRWDSRWRFVGLGDAAEWQASALELEAALRNGIDGAYGRLIKLYAPIARDETVVDLQIDGISSMSEAERCSEYLRGLPIVKRADWMRAEASMATWKLTLAGRSETLRQILAVSRALRPVPGEEPGQDLVYRWTP